MVNLPFDLGLCTYCEENVKDTFTPLFHRVFGGFPHFPLLVENSVENFLVVVKNAHGGAWRYPLFTIMVCHG